MDSPEVTRLTQQIDELRKRYFQAIDILTQVIHGRNGENMKELGDAIFEARHWLSQQQQDKEKFE